jgi:hypothetical protein
MSDLVKKDPSLVRQKLEGTLQAGSLAQLVKERKRERETFLLLDVSGSMLGFTEEHSQTRKIDALKRLVSELREELTCPMVAFAEKPSFVSEHIPAPGGWTNLTAAIQFAQQHEAAHLIVISDGLPDSQEASLRAAKAFGGPIDVFYVGPPGDYGEAFLKALAAASGGKSQTISLAQTKQLSSAIRGLLTAGGD